MKKIMTILLVCIMFVLPGTMVEASGREPGFAITFQGEATGQSTMVFQGTHYLPMRMICEKMGASVYFRSSDRQVLVLSRDGDIIRHIVGDTVVTMNGETMIFDHPSVSENGVTYIPVGMVSALFHPDAISYDNKTLNIQKQFFSNEYHKIIKDVLEVSKEGSFYPERFQRYINYHAGYPDYSIQEVVFRVNLGLDIPFYQEITTIQNPYELLVLVNKYNKLPEKFTQYNLVPVSVEYANGSYHLLAEVAYQKYKEMADAAREEGLSLRIISAYRTEDTQRYLYDNKLRTTGKTYADSYSARAGHSEHQTGLAVDIGATRVAFENTKEFQWMQEHAHEYGYILRYQKGKEWITGYAYEPWHYRYVGTDVAKIIFEEGITYEEYYAKYISVNEFK